MRTLQSGKHAIRDNSQISADVVAANAETITTAARYPSVQAPQPLVGGPVASDAIITGMPPIKPNNTIIRPSVFVKQAAVDLCGGTRKALTAVPPPHNPAAPSTAAAAAYLQEHGVHALLASHQSQQLARSGADPHEPQVPQSTSCTASPPVMKKCRAPLHDRGTASRQHSRCDMPSPQITGAVTGMPEVPQSTLGPGRSSGLESSRCGTPSPQIHGAATGVSEVPQYMRGAGESPELQRSRCSTPSPHLRGVAAGENTLEELRSALSGLVQTAERFRPPSAPTETNKVSPGAPSPSSARTETACHLPRSSEQRPGDGAAGDTCCLESRNAEACGLPGNGRSEEPPHATEHEASLQPVSAQDANANERGTLPEHSLLRYPLPVFRVRPQDRRRAAALPATLVPLATFFRHPAGNTCQPASRAFSLSAGVIVANAQRQHKRLRAARTGKMLATDKNTQAALDMVKSFWGAYHTAVRARCLKGSSACHAAAAAAEAMKCGVPEPRPPSPRLRPSPVQRRTAPRPQQQWMYSAHAPIPAGHAGAVDHSCSSGQKRRRLMGKRGRT
jgi:hypothetical protein